MRLLHENFFNLPKSLFAVAGDFHDERKLLAQEQKLCQNRARKIFLDTNRRRKASEERQKQREEQEKLQREKILQQRRERVKDATERFQRGHLPPSQRGHHPPPQTGHHPPSQRGHHPSQRGHLPPSQRQRQTFTRNIPNIEDALSQIQGPLGSNTQQSSLLSRKDGSCISSPKLAHGQGLSVLEAHTEMLLEEETVFSKNHGKDTSKSQQDSIVSDMCDHSQDSLESDDRNHDGDHLWSPRFSLHNLENLLHTSDFPGKQNHYLTIKDNIDLPQEKKDVKTKVKKKVHWFDDVTTPASTGDPWTNVILSQGRADVVKVVQSAPLTVSPKVPWRENPVRARAIPVSSRRRKATAVRPQSATEVDQFAKTQGRIMVPCPPPLEEKVVFVTKTPYGVDQTCVDSKHAVAGEPALHRSVKSKLSSGQQETEDHETRREPESDEGDFCLQRTPTDEEIANLWHSVRRTLNIRDGKQLAKYKELKSGRAVRKPFSEQSRQPLGWTIRRPPPPFQPSKKLLGPARISDLTHQGVGRAARLHLAELLPACRLEKGPGPRPPPTSLSLEEQKVYLSLEKIDHKLHCLQKYTARGSATPGLVLMDGVSTMKNVFSANECPWYLKKS